MTEMIPKVIEWVCVFLPLVACASIAAIFCKKSEQKCHRTRDKPADLYFGEIDGELIIDTKDPHKDTFRFELYYDPVVILEDKTKEYIQFKIIRNDE